MGAFDSYLKKYGVAGDDKTPATSGTTFDDYLKKYGVSATEQGPRDLGVGSGVFSAPDTFSSSARKQPPQVDSKVVEGTGLGTGIVMPTQQQATSALADVSKKMHEDSAKRIEDAKQAAKNPTEEYQRAEAMWENVKYMRAQNRSDEEIEKAVTGAGYAGVAELEKLVKGAGWDAVKAAKDARDKAAQNYYAFSGRDAVYKVLEMKGAANALNLAAEAAAEALALLKSSSNGMDRGMSELLSEAYAKRARAMELLLKTGVDEETAEHAVEYMAEQIRAGKAAEYAKETQEWANAHKGGATALSILTAPAQGFDYITALLGNSGHNSTKDIENYKPLTGADFVATATTQGLREGASADMGGFGKFLYNTGMSIADSALLVSTIGPAASVVLGMGAASNTAKDVIERGGTNNQALAAGLAAGAAEVIFEKVSIDNLLKIKNVTDAKVLVSNVLKQAGTEASEEALTEIANIISDAAIMGQGSSFNTAVKAYQKQGMSEEAAKQKAVLDNIAQIGLAAAGGALSGGAMGGGASVGSYIYNRAYQDYLGKNFSQDRISVLSVAQEYAEGSQTRDMANKIHAAVKSAMDNGTELRVSDNQWGRLLQSMENEKAQFGPKVEGGVTAPDVEQALHPDEAVMSPSAQAFMDAGDDAKTADAKSKIFDRIRNGDTTLRNADLRALDLESASTRAVFKNVLGVELPPVSDGHQLNRAALNAAKAIADARAQAQQVQAQAQAQAQAQVQAEPQVTEEAVSEAEQQARAIEAEAAEMAKQIPQLVEAEQGVQVDTGAGAGVQERSSLGEIPTATNVPQAGVSGATQSSANSLLDYITRVHSENATVRERTQGMTVQALNQMLESKGSRARVELAHGGATGFNAVWTPDGKIQVNADKLSTQKLIYFTLTHELFHEASNQMGGESSEWTRSAAKELIALGESGKIKIPGYENKSWSEYKAAAREAQIRQHMNADLPSIRAGFLTREQSRQRAEAKLTEDFLNEEYAADVLRSVFAQTGNLKLLASERRTVLTKIRDWLQSRFTELLKGGAEGKGDLLTEMNDLVKKVNDALTNTAERGTMNKNEPQQEVRFSGREESADYRERQDAGRVDRGQQTGHLGGRRDAEGRLRRSGDLGAHEGDLIPEATRRIMNEKGIPDLGLRETHDRSAFSNALEAAKAANPNGGMVDSQSVEWLEQSGARMFLREDGLAGVAVESDGNIVGVFKHPDLKVTLAVNDLLCTAIANGGTHLDCYATYGVGDLRTKYALLGFRPVAYLEFNREYAAEDWNYAAWGEPDVVMWVHNGASIEEILNHEEPYAVPTRDEIHELEKFEDYDEAKAKQKSEIGKTDERYSVSPDSVPDWDAQVNALLNGSFDELFWGDGQSRSSMYVLYEPTALLQELGLSDLPLVITQKHAQDSLRDRWADSGEVVDEGFHGITEAQFRRLPELIRHPVAVFRDDPKSDHPGGVNILTEEKDAKGNPVFVSVKPDQPQFTWDKKSGPAHFVNVFGRKNARGFISRAIENGDVLFMDKAKFDADPWLAPTAEPALSTADSIESGTIIGQKRPTVKPGDRKFSVDGTTLADVDTKGNPISERQAEYFKGTKVVDSKGRLKVVYHGTTAEFNTFRRGDIGYHFGNKTTARTRVGRGKGSRLMECYLDIKNPITFDYDLGSWDADYRLTEELFDMGVLTQDEVKSVLLTDSGKYRRGTGDANRKLRELLLRKGYDGILYRNTFESDGSTSYIVFESRQAKLVSNNEPTESADVRYSISVDKDAELSFFGLDSLNDYVGVQKKVYQKLLDSGFLRSDTRRRVVVNKDSGMEIEIGRGGINETFGPGSRFKNLPRRLKELKVATIRHLPEIIEDGVLTADDQPNEHNPGSGLRYAYIRCDIEVDGDPMTVSVDIRKSRQKNKFWIHEVRVSRKNPDLSADAANAGKASSEGGVYNGSVADDGETVKHYSVSGKPSTGGNTGNVNPETGFQRGSVADSFMRMWNVGAQDEALSMLESVITRLAQLEADASERRLADLRRAVLSPRVTENIAERNRERVERLIAKYGMMPQTSAAQQEVRLPEQIDDETRVAGAVQTVMAAGVTTELIRDELVQDVLSGNAGVTYARIGDRATLDQVDKEYEKYGHDVMMKQWKNKFTGNEALSKLDIARAEKLYVEMVGSKDPDIGAVLELVAEIAAAGTQAGQAVQAMTLLKKMTPAGQLYYIEKAVNRLNKDPRQKTPISINKALAEKLAKAQTRAEINAAVDELINDIAQQVPVSLADKWNTWRYFAMLGNPRTHIRNLMGNAIFAPARLAKDAIGTLLEKALPQNQRTKALTASEELREFAEQDAEEMQDILRGGGKYNPSDMIRDKRKIFKRAEWLNKATQKNSELLEKEDWIFLGRAYQRALSGFLSARGVTDTDSLLDTPEGRKTLNEAREYAVHEAQRATYRDMSKLAGTLNHLKRKHKALGLFLDGIVPFTKTPINIVKRGFEYSPLGLAKTIYDAVNRGVAVKQIESGKTVKRDFKSAAEIIDELSANLTGTGVVLLGYLLAKMGLLTAGLGDDDEDKFKELYGEQAYSLNIPGVGSYTIDWMAPVALPLFVGAEIFGVKTEGYDGLGIDEIADGLTTILEPMLSLSMLDGLNDALSANKFGDSSDALWNIASAAIGSYLSQGIPTVFGQVARTIDPNRRTSFTEKGAGVTEATLQRFWQSSVQGKVPFYENEKMAYIDAWGRTDTTGSVLVRAVENFLSPGYINANRKTDVETELERLAAELKDTSVMPDRAQKYFTVNRETYAMSQDEYQAHLIDRGQTSYALVNDFLHDPAYDRMDDAGRAKVINDIYDYAAQSAKYRTNSGYKRDDWVVDLADYVAKGGDAVDYLTMKQEYGTRNVGNGVYARDDLTVIEASTLVLGGIDGEQRAPSSFTDPYAKGYVYELNGAQQARYTETYDRLFNERFPDLYASDEYRDATPEERKKLVSDLRADVVEDVKYELADWLWEQGVESKLK